MPLFFSCSYLLEPGSVVAAGNWGRMIRTYTPQRGNAWNLAREMLWEEVRRDSFPDKPSRFDSIFLCPTREGITEFSQRANRNFDLQYEVELIDPGAPQHNGCWQSVAWPENQNYAQVIKLAQAYWSGLNIRKPEFVTTSSIRILTALD